MADTVSNSSYISPVAFGNAGTISTYTFGGDGSGDITPVLLSGTDSNYGSNTFTITGGGATRVGGAGALLIIAPSVCIPSASCRAATAALPAE